MLQRTLRQWALASSVAFLARTGSAASFAEAPPLEPAAPTASTDPHLAQLGSSQGRPKVELDRLSFPKHIEGASAFERHLRHSLAREARTVDWGAGSGNRIEYRFSVDALILSEQDGVLSVTCRASGRLPNGATARSTLSFGGAPKERTALVKRVLDIVARGVIARLAELERQRRGQR